MRTTHTKLLSALLAAAVAGACSPDREPAPEPEPLAQLPPVTAAPPVQPVPEAVLVRLEQEIPQLRGEPAPEPRPSPNANPERVPDRVQQRASDRVLQTARGPATFYADYFEGRRTASGIPFRQNQMVAAHRSYPFGTILRVTNTRNERSVNVKVVDRGPFARPRNAAPPVLDLSRRAAQQLGFIQAGRAPVLIEVLEWGQGVAT